MVASEVRVIMELFSSWMQRVYRNDAVLAVCQVDEALPVMPSGRWRIGG